MLEELCKAKEILQVVSRAYRNRRLCQTLQGSSQNLRIGVIVSSVKQFAALYISQQTKSRNQTGSICILGSALEGSCQLRAEQKPYALIIPRDLQEENLLELLRYHRMQTFYWQQRRFMFEINVPTMSCHANSLGKQLRERTSRNCIVVTRTTIFFKRLIWSMLGSPSKFGEAACVIKAPGCIKFGLRRHAPEHPQIWYQVLSVQSQNSASQI